MIHLEETPWWICDEGDKNFCAYVDTDSNYFNAEPLLLHLYPDFESKTDEEKDNLLEQIALKYQDIITSHYDELARDCFNVGTHRLEMKTECVIRSAYFRATRRYAQWITKQEGIAKEQTKEVKRQLSKNYKEALRAEIDGYIRALSEQMRNSLSEELQRSLPAKVELASNELRARG